MDDQVSKYVKEFGSPEKKNITIRQILNMTSGLEFPSHEHEKMFFEDDHMKYALNVGVESQQEQNLNTIM